MALTLLWVLQLAFSFADSLQKKVCMGETFEAKCWKNEAIVVQSATYGRMQLGRCITSDMGYLGCKTDVLPLADAWCSGRRSCAVGITNKDLDRINTCFGELRTYLDITYDCLKVVYGDAQFCETEPRVELHSANGVLSSHVTEETGCGSKRAPWIIEASPGQRINISMTDFGIWRPGDLIERTSVVPARTNCDTYGYIVEREAGVNISLCGGTERSKHIYLSQGSTVEIILTPEHRRGHGHFLLTYQTLGCPDLNPPAHAWYKRDGDTAKVGCEWNSKSWHLKCIDHRWLGVVGNCSDGGPHAAQSIDGSYQVSTAVSIIIVIGLAVLVAVTVCGAGIIYLYLRRKKLNKRRKYEQKRVQGSVQQKGRDKSYRPVPQHSDGTKTGGKKRDPPPPPPRHSSDPTTVTGTGQALPITGGKNDYAHIWDTSLPEPCHQTTGDSDYASQSNLSTTTGHSKFTYPYEDIGSRGSMASPMEAKAKEHRK